MLTTLTLAVFMFMLGWRVAPPRKVVETVIRTEVEVQEVPVLELPPLTYDEVTEFEPGIGAPLTAAIDAAHERIQHCLPEPVTRVLDPGRITVLQAWGEWWAMEGYREGLEQHRAVMDNLRLSLMDANDSMGLRALLIRMLDDKMEYLDRAVEIHCSKQTKKGRIYVQKADGSKVSGRGADRAVPGDLRVP